MKKDIYLGDIDPNNSILPAIQIRRIIMFQLLMWDKIILSDSQFLTDPRINILMGGYDSKEVFEENPIADIPDYLKGIEVLFENGLIDVAVREKSGSKETIPGLWESMMHSEKKVPYLPQDEKYVAHLDSVKFNQSSYELSNMSGLFQHNLLTGINTAPEMGGIILAKTGPEAKLLDYFKEESPLFRNMLDYLRAQRDVKLLSPERYTELYDFIYSCYSVNISSALDCSINTKFRHIPLHLDSGLGDFKQNLEAEQIADLRPTWGLNPLFLDHLTFEEFLELRKRLQPYISRGKILDFYLGLSGAPGWESTISDWEFYTMILEDTIELAIRKKKNLIDDLLIKENVDKRLLKHPEQQTIITSVTELVKSGVTVIPVVSEVLGTIDVLNSCFKSVVSISKRDATIDLVKQYNNINSLLAPETRVITKYGNPFGQ